MKSEVLIDHQVASGAMLARDNITSDFADSILLIREPILDVERVEQGCELRYRGAPSDSQREDDGTYASRRAMHCALHVVGLNSLTNGKRAFLDVTSRIILEDEHTLLPSQRVVLQLHPINQPLPILREACQRARRDHYTLAWQLASSSMIPWELIEPGDIIRLTLNDAVVHLSRLQRDFLGAPLLFHGVHTAHDLERARELGCMFVQGRFFCEPRHDAVRELQGAEVTRMKLLTELSKPVIDFDDIEAIVKSDASLAYHLLQYLNSAAFGIRERITSIRQALLMLGEQPLRKWGSLIALTALGKRETHVLLMASLVRARFCESLVATRYGDDLALDAFLTGLLSSLDMLLGVQMAELIKTLNLSEEVCAVLLGKQTGLLGTTLALVMAAERGAWSTVASLATRCRLTHRDIACRYYETLDWVHSLHSPSMAPAS